MTLGQKLRQARQARGLTQAQVVGDRITRNMLSQIENDLASPSVGTLEYLASVLGVKLAWLLADEQEQAELTRTQQLRERYRAGDYAGCLSLAPEGKPDDEQALLLALCAAQCARHALLAERFEAAQRLAAQALRWNQESLYESLPVKLQMYAVQARCALETEQKAPAGKPSSASEPSTASEPRSAAPSAQSLDASSAFTRYQTLYHTLGPSTLYALTAARQYLAHDRLAAAEQALASVLEVSAEEQAELLILRGRLAEKKHDHARAAALLRQADALGPLPKLFERELCQSMELASRELQDYKTAYEFAARQLQL